MNSEKTKTQAACRASWKKYAEKWKASGLTQKEYCRREKINLHTFHYWQKKLKTESKPNTKQFIKVKLKPTIAYQENGSIEVQIGTQYRLLLKGYVNKAMLKNVLEGIKEAAC